MASKKAEERNEKIIRGLMKLPPNRRCINCNNLGPQYVCTNFWTFICTTCSGIHREFTHRVKSVSMAKFTSQEIEALQSGGNQRARENFLTEWDTQRHKLPNSNNVERIREFIKDVYVDKRYAVLRSSDKPPGDVQSSKNQEEESRRASSYHSFSQSPPYEHQYEDRRYGQLRSALTRKGSDRGQYVGRFSSSVYSPGRLGGQTMFEDRFANEVPGSRASDCSASTISDRFGGIQSPNFQKDVEYISPPVQPLRDILGDDGQSPTDTKRDVDVITRPQRIASSGGFGSFDNNSVSLKSVNAGGVIYTGLDLKQSAGPRSSVCASASSQEPFHAPFMQPLSTSLASPIDLFADATHLQPSVASLERKPSAVSFIAASQGPFQASFVQPLEQKPSFEASSAPSIDLFADAIHLHPSKASLEQNPSEISISVNEGWATFDLPQHVAPTHTQIQNASPALVTSADGLAQRNFQLLSSLNNSLQWSSIQNTTTLGSLSSMANQWHGATYEGQVPTGPTSSQLWNAFGDSNESLHPASYENLLSKCGLQGGALTFSASGNQDTKSRSSEESGKDGFQRSVAKDLVTVPTLSVDGAVSGSFFPSPVLASVDEPYLVSRGGMPLQAHDRKSINPFDLAYDSEVESCSMVSDMGPLQAALPNPTMPAFLGGLNPSWFRQDPVPPFMPAVPQGSSAFMGGQGPTS